MPNHRYDVNQRSIQTILTWIDSDEIAIPEIQRPFVWNSTKVRDLIDSLYRGYPVGYLITWQTPDVRLKDGSKSKGKRILIDGQQRVTALFAALLGQKVVNKDYSQKRITIAFHPGEQRFEVSNAAIRKSQEWIPDIAVVFDPNIKLLKFVEKYCEINHDLDKDDLFNRLETLKAILHNSLGLIELNSDLGVETVTEIFVRINSQGVALNSSDFAMSKMAASEQYDGHLLRKSIDYFCHLAIAPESYHTLSQDDSFVNTDYFKTMEWLKNEREDLYDPSYTDMLRVTFTTEFKRGRLGDLVALLSGRNFEMRRFEEEIAETSFSQLKDGVLNYMNETNFKRFIMILRSAGFVTASMIRSKSTLNFAYILYLTLRKENLEASKIETMVRRWFVMSILTARYTGSPETAFDVDIRNIDEHGAEQYLKRIELSDLSDAFWEVGLPQNMDTSVASSPYFNVFLASQVKANDKGFLSSDISVRDLLEGQSNIHHIFPRKYLQSQGLTRGSYNQIANYVVMQSEINIAIGAKEPTAYFSEVIEQCQNGTPRFGGISDHTQLQENLDSHCIPQGIETKTVESYDEFLKERRNLISVKIRDYYKSL